MGALAVDPAFLDPQAIFFNLGLEGCKRKILRADRLMAMRLGRDMLARASDFLTRTEPKKFVPRRPELARMRRFLESDLEDVNPELLEVVKSAQGHLSQLAPQELSNDFVPLEYVPHSLQLTVLRRAFAILERPRTLFSLALMGGVMGDEVDALIAAVPEVYGQWLKAIVGAAIEERAADRRWQPSRQAKFQLPVIIGAGSVAIPEVADIFAASKAREQQAQQGGGGNGDTVSNVSDAQRSAGRLPTPREMAK